MLEFLKITGIGMLIFTIILIVVGIIGFITTKFSIIIPILVFIGCSIFIGTVAVSIYEDTSYYRRKKLRKMFNEE